MKIKWGNIFALAILLVLFRLLFTLPEVIERISWDLRLPYYFDDPVYGLMFLGLICVTIVVVIKMIINR